VCAGSISAIRLFPCDQRERLHGLVAAADGALCLMGRFSGPGHIGVWPKPEGKIIHCDRRIGVCLEDIFR
jgi:hypothetical protein